MFYIDLSILADFKWVIRRFPFIFITIYRDVFSHRPIFWRSKCKQSNEYNILVFRSLNYLSITILSKFWSDIETRIKGSIYEDILTTLFLEERITIGSYWYLVTNYQVLVYIFKSFGSTIDLYNKLNWSTTYWTLIPLDAYSFLTF